MYAAPHSTGGAGVLRAVLSGPRASGCLVSSALGLFSAVHTPRLPSTSCSGVPGPPFFCSLMLLTGAASADAPKALQTCRQGTYRLAQHHRKVGRLSVPRAGGGSSNDTLFRVAGVCPAPGGAHPVAEAPQQRTSPISRGNESGVVVHVPLHFVGAAVLASRAPGVPLRAR